MNKYCHSLQVVIEGSSFSGATQWRPRTIQSANIWTVSSMGHKESEREDIKTIVARWDKANKIYYGPDRDFKNFPTLKIPESEPTVRMGVFPSYWFDAFYEKTGVTGKAIISETKNHFNQVCEKEY